MPFYAPSPLKRATKTITFTGAAGLGAIGTFNLFTTTGELLVAAIAPFCTTLVGVDAGTGAASMQLGVVSATNLFVLTTPAADIDANEFWVDATPDLNGIALPAACKDIVITQNIQGEVTSTGTQLVNSGVLRVDVFWMALSSDGLLVAA